jgi:hypothetical protein
MYNLIQGYLIYTFYHKCFGGRGHDVIRVLFRGIKIWWIPQRGRGCREGTKQWREIARNLRITHLFLDFLCTFLSDFTYKINWETVRIYEWWPNEGNFVELFVKDKTFHGKTRRKHSTLKLWISGTKSRIVIHINLLNATTIFLLTSTFVIRNLPLGNQFVLNKTYLPDRVSSLDFYPLEKHCTTLHTFVTSHLTTILSWTEILTFG